MAVSFVPRIGGAMLYNPNSRAQYKATQKLREVFQANLCSQACPRLEKAVEKQTSPNKSYATKPFSSIPGPRRLPIIGSLWPYKIGLKSNDFYHEHLREMYDSYGPIVREDQSSTVIIHVFDPEDIRTVYRSTTVPHVAPLLQTAKDYKENNDLNLGLGNTNGAEWEMLRKAVNKFTLKPQAANQHIPKQDKVSQEAVSALERLMMDDGSVPHLEELIDTWITDSLATVVGGRQQNHLQELTLQQLQKDDNFAVQLANENRRIFELSTALKMSTGLYKRFNTPKASELKQIEDSFYGKLRVVCDSLLEEKRSRLEGEQKQGEVKDAAADDSILYNLVKDSQLSTADLLTITMSLLTDGYSTTAPTLLGALHCLALSPAVQDELYQHLLQVLPQDVTAGDEVGAQLTSDMLSRASKLSAFVKEVLRLYPIGDGVQRLLTQDMVLSGYHLPEGTRLDLNPYIWLRDPAVFPDPHSVLLGRWSRPPTEGVTDAFHPILNTPFSTGVRTCVGRRLAEHDMSCLMVRLLLRWRVSLGSPKSPRQIYRVLLRPHTPLPLLFHRR